MKTFIIYWCLTLTLTTPCPTIKYVDEFAVENVAYCNCLRYSKKYIVDCNMDKKFKNLDSAVRFYNKLKRNNCDSVRLLCY